MTTLLLRLAGPMQSWGSSSRFSSRHTELAPTKSGVLGLVASAQGRRRTDEVTDLAALRFGVRVDQPGRVERDFQTARLAEHLLTGNSRHDNMPITRRYYLSDAVFIAAIEGDRAIVEAIADSIKSPHFPLYLGRRSCPPSAPIVIGVTDKPLATALREADWAAASWWQRKSSKTVALELLMDEHADSPDVAGDSVTQRDVPIAFNPERREYGWRTVTRSSCTVNNPRGVSDSHEPFAALGGA